MNTFHFTLDSLFLLRCFVFLEANSDLVANKQLPFNMSTIIDISEKKIKSELKSLVVYHLETNSLRSAPGQAKNKSVVII